MVGFAATTTLIDDTNKVVGLLTIFRLVQGAASTAVHSSIYAISSIIFSNTQTRSIAVIYSCGSIGMTTSPSLSSFLSKLGGFTIPFVFTAVLLMGAVVGV